MLEKIKSEKKLEYITLFLFVLTYCIITVFHEPWFDEAQAWQIAKCASLKEIFFEIPHYEGHPPLWWLLLSIPAKLGVPFEIGLKTIGLLISTTSAILMIFHSKLPRIIRFKDKGTVLCPSSFISDEICKKIIQKYPDAQMHQNFRS